MLLIIQAKPDMSLLSRLGVNTSGPFVRAWLQCVRRQTWGEIPSGVAVRCEGGVVGEGSLLVNESLIPGVSASWYSTLLSMALNTCSAQVY